MKQIILITSLIITSLFNAFGQEDSYNNTHSLGLNINSIVNSSDFGVFYSPSTPYTLIYRFNMKNWALKAGFGGNFSNNERDNESGQGNSGSSKNHILDARIGFDRTIMNKNRFSFMLGADVIFQTSRNYNEIINSSSILSRYENKGRSMGFGPTGTVDFKITESISLSTEMSFYISRNNNEYIRNDNSTNNQDQKDISKGWSSALNKPTALYLNIRF